MSLDVKISPPFQVDGGFGTSKFPAVPGHEVAGVVTTVGPEVKDLEVPDRVKIN